MRATHPYARGDSSALTETLDSLDECARTSALCADACLGEDTVAELRRCIDLSLDGAVLCTATAAVASRQAEPDSTVMRAALEACIAACEACATECERHAGMHEPCEVCAESCRRCADACRTQLRAVK